MYKNYDDLEDSLTQEELELMYDKAYKLREEEYRFLAALQGIEMPDPEKTRVEDKIREMEARALAIENGGVEEEYLLEGLFQFIDEDEQI